MTFSNVLNSSAILAIQPDGSIPIRDFVQGIEIYFGTPMSGSYIHAHGTAVASSSSEKLWILFSPELQCDLNTEVGTRMLAHARLPPLCNETDPKQVKSKAKRISFRPGGGPFPNCATKHPRNRSKTKQNRFHDQILRNFRQHLDLGNQLQLVPTH